MLKGIVEGLGSSEDWPGDGLFGSVSRTSLREILRPEPVICQGDAAELVGEASFKANCG